MRVFEVRRKHPSARGHLTQLASVTGVYWCRPKQNTFYTFRESVLLGRTRLSHQQIARVLAEFRSEWQGFKYDMLGRNCNHFCDELSRKLVGEGTPLFLNRFAVGAEVTVRTLTPVFLQLQRLGAMLQETSQAARAWIASNFSGVDCFGGGGSTQ